jgi:hypothetical protein
VFLFGPETVTTKVRMMLPPGAGGLDLDLADLVIQEAAPEVVGAVGQDHR